MFFTKCKIPSCHYYKPKKVEGLISPVGLTCKDKNINNHEPKIRETSLISTSVESTAASMHKQTPPARNSDVSIKNSDSAVTQSIETNNPLQSENDLRTLNIYFTNEEFEILKRYKDNSKTSLIKRRVDPKIILLREREQFPLRMFVLNNTYFAELNAWDAKVWANLIFKDGQLQTEKYFLSLKQMLMTSFPHTKKQEVCK